VTRPDVLVELTTASAALQRAYTAAKDAARYELAAEIRTAGVLVANSISVVVRRQQMIEAGS
jgi:hypothetical protein